MLGISWGLYMGSLPPSNQPVRAQIEPEPSHEPSGGPRKVWGLGNDQSYGHLFLLTLVLPTIPNHPQTIPKPSPERPQTVPEQEGTFWRMYGAICAFWGGAGPPDRGQQKYGSQCSPSPTLAPGDRELNLQVPFVISHAEIPSAGSGVGGLPTLA